MASLPAVPLPLCSQDVLQNGKTKEEVRGTLLDGLDRCLGCQGAKPNIVEEEVDHFLQRGRVSDSNLSRLQRRVQAKLGQGGRSACGSVSSYSARTERSRSSFVESPRSCAYDALVPLALPEEGDKMPRVPEDEVLRWSNLAKLATKAAQLEDAQKREAQRKAQQQMRACLQEQVEQKTLRQKKDAEDEMKFFESQTADLERWKQDQKKLAEERKEKMKQVVRDRKANTEEVLRSKEVERKRRSSEDRRLILRAAKEMELERQAVEERKHASQVAQSVLLQDIRAKKGPKEARQLRIQEEKQALAEYSLLLERQEARSQESKPRIRDQNPAAPPQAARKGVELYYDPDTVMRIRNEALAREEQVDKEKEERQRTERQMNQARIFSPNSLLLFSLRKNALATLAGRAPELCVRALCPGLVLLLPCYCPLVALASPVSSSGLLLVFLWSSCPPLVLLVSSFCSPVLLFSSLAQWIRRVLLLKGNSTKQPQRMSSPCPPAVLFLQWPQCQAVPASPVRMFSSSPHVTIFSILCSSCSSIAFLLSFFSCALVVAASISPAVVLPPGCCASLVLSSSSGLVHLVLRSPLGVLPSCCPLVLLALSGHSLAFFCLLGVLILFSFPIFLLSSVVFLMSSFGLSVVLLFTLLSKAGAAAAAAHHHNNIPAD